MSSVSHAASALIAVFVVAAAFPPVAMAAETIVGTWHYEGSDCAPMNQIRIGPMSIESHEAFTCRFKDVSRDGNAVRWTGQCTDFGFENGDAVAKTGRAVVGAKQIGNRLFIRTNDGQPIVAQRCQGR